MYKCSSDDYKLFAIDPLLSHSHDNEIWEESKCDSKKWLTVELFSKHSLLALFNHDKRKIERIVALDGRGLYVIYFSDGFE